MKPACIKKTSALAVASQTMSLASFPSVANAKLGISAKLNAKRVGLFIMISCIGGSVLHHAGLRPATMIATVMPEDVLIYCTHNMYLVTNI